MPGVNTPDVGGGGGGDGGSAAGAQHGSGGPHPPMMVIPPKFRAGIKKTLGYNGPWRLPSTEAKDILKDYLREVKDDGNNTSGLSPTEQALIDVLNNLAGSGSSSSSSSSSANQGLTEKQKANLRNSYLNIIQTWFGSHAVTKNLRNLVETGVKQEWSTTSFMVHLRSTAEYKHQFPGIGGRDGVSEASYNRMYDQYLSAARKVGLNVSRQQFGIVFKRHVEFSEWQTRMDFFERASRNRDYFKQLERVAEARGLIKPNEKFTERDIFNLMTHRGSPAIERLMEESQVRFQLKSIGLTVGKHGDIARGRVLSFIQDMEAQGVETEQLNNQAFASLAQKVQEVLPSSDLYGMGITKQDLFTLEFGGGNEQKRATIAEQVRRVLATVESEKQPTVLPTLIEDEGGSRLSSGAITRPTGL